MKTNPLKFLTSAWLVSMACSAMVSADEIPTPSSPSMINRATGGTVSASSEQRSAMWNETATHAFDGSNRTKWFNVPDGRSHADKAYQSAWLQYHFSNEDHWIVTEYRITSANDVPVRDPKDWEFQGSNDGINWVVLDTRSNQKFERRQTANTYTITNTTAYAYYRLNITASSKAGDGIQLAELELLAAAGPVAPADVSAKAVEGGVGLSWTESPGATHYRVQRATTSGDAYNEIAARVEGLSYTDTSIKGGGTFYYVVEAVSAIGASQPSSEASAVVVATPTGLSATPGRDQVTLHWSPIDGEVTYSLKRATNQAGPFTLIAANILKPVCTDTALAGGLTYHYVVTATKDGHESFGSAPVKVLLPPATPTQFAVSLEKKHAVASWRASPGAVSYALKRATSSEGPYRVVAAAVTATTATDADVNSGRTYFYVVSATNAAGDSLVSDPMSVKVPGLFQRN